MSMKIPGDGIWLLAAAAPREASAVLDAFGLNTPPELWVPVRLHDRFELVRTGVGKSNAAGAVASVIDASRYAGVLSVGIAGVLPGGGHRILDTVCASRSVFSDEGVGTPGGFINCAEMGFAPFDNGEMGIDHDPRVIEWLGSLCDAHATIACVSWCSGDDGCARGVVSRTGASVEAMEGASIALVAQRLGVLSGELRVISNTTGNRADQRWDLDGAMERLSTVLGRLASMGA
ncbi:MAG: futalosine hydrolase [Phycisphaerales bacterium]|nr:futalosine hydrolase [Phycisphaerales bacterium]